MVTIKDVARKAGVSVATVSRVFNDSDLVHEDTRQRVRGIAEELRYVPHGAARSLITSRTNTIGVLLPDLHGEFFSEVIRGIDLTARQHGYNLLVSSSHNESSDIEAALRAMRGWVDGLIVMAPDMDAQSAMTSLPEHIPVVLLNSPTANGTGRTGRRGRSMFDSIGIANFEGACAMVRHLARRGHRRIAMIKGAERNHDAAERLRGYRAALREAGIRHSSRLEMPGDFREASGYQAATQLLSYSPRPTAIFAANDSMAIGALSALRQAGLRVPADMAIAGFDDIPMARYMHPALSTVHVEISALGERAVRRLLTVIASGSQRERWQETVATSLVIRDSCGGSTS